MAERPRVLVVESSTALREVACEILIQARFYPCPAESLERATLQLVACQPHVVLAAYRLVDGTAVDLVRAMHEKGYWRPVVGVTGRKESQEKLAAEGVTRFLGKPYSAADLLRAVREALATDV